MNEAKLQVVVIEGADGFDGLNVYDLNDKLIDQIAYDKSLPVDEQIEAAKKEVTEKYEIVEAE